jgi:potassium/hydrogen antiporter
MTVKDVILTIAIMLGAGLVCQLIADFARVPRMLVLLVAGALLGPAVSDAIDVPLDSMGAQLLLSLGVSFILFHGGLQLSTQVLSRVAVGLTLLAIPGVVFTAFIAGTVAALVFGLPLTSGLLIGAVLAPTDPAILIPLFERLGLRPKISQTIIAESALNDPTGAVLALAVSGVVISGSASLTQPLQDFVVNLLISTALGVVFGVVLSAAVSSRRAGIWRESAAIAVMAVIAVSYFSIDTAGGSGYLGAFLAGLIVGNMEQLGLAMHSEHERDMRVLVSTVADVMVIFVFLMLGANIPWSDIRTELAPALAVVFALILLARPFTVFLCLVPDRRGSWSREEIVFLAWTRETGVVPAALAGIMVGLHVPDANLIVITVALAIIVTLSVQSTTKRWLARRLRLIDTIIPPGPVPADGTPAVGVPAR